VSDEPPRRRFGRTVSTANTASGNATVGVQAGTVSTANTASGNATVGVQVGTVLGDIRYETPPDASPEKKFEVAKRCVEGKMTPRAKQLIEEALEGELVTPGSAEPLVNEVAYYWKVAVLSDQPYEVLEKEDFAALRRAGWLCRNGPADEWGNAHRVVTGMVACLQAKERTGTFDTTALDRLKSALDRLSIERRTEIYRHLDPILSNVLGDRQEADVARVAREQRMEEDRERRVWKFFEPEPERPRPRVPRQVDFGLFERTAAGCGAALAMGGLILTFSLVARAGVTGALTTGGVLLVSVFLVSWFGPEQLPARYSALYPKRPRPEPTDFSAHVEWTARRQFAKNAPRSAAQRAAWSLAVRKPRGRLVQEIVDLYAEPAPRTPRAVDWLIAWYAEEAARRWAAHEPGDRWSPVKLVALTAGITGLVGAWYQAMTVMWDVQGSISLAAMLWLLSGVALLALGQVDVHLVRWYADAVDRLEADRILEEETDAYEERVALLADRPDDAQMARWLDYDKIHLKTLAMNQYGLTNRDLIAHAVLPEAATSARRARVKGGQPRFSAYNVWVFLLTVSGVRQVRIRLDFPTGAASDQRRTAFRYDAIASAQVEEVGVRFDDGRREVALPLAAKEKAEVRRWAVPIYQEFRLALVNRDTIDITVDTFDSAVLEQLLDEPDVPRPDLADLAGALSLLEIVAANGVTWLEQVQSRRDLQPLDHEPDLSATA
jgi:hypothetical protein